MRQSTGTINTFRFMIVFILIFASFLTIAISYNKVIRMKNESLLIIEKYEGVTEKSLSIINNFLYQNGYRSTGTCDEDEVGVKDLTSEVITLDNIKGERYFYCLKKSVIRKGSKIDYIYYDLKLFFNFKLDLFDGVDLMNFHIQSETRRIVYHQDILYKL